MKNTLSLSFLVLATACGGGESPRHEVPSDVSVCVERQRALYEALRTYADGHGGAGADTGCTGLDHALGF